MFIYINCKTTRIFTDQIILIGDQNKITADFTNLNLKQLPFITSNLFYKLYINGVLNSQGKINRNLRTLNFNKDGLFSDYQFEVSDGFKTYVAKYPYLDDMVKSNDLNKVEVGSIVEFPNYDQFKNVVRSNTLKNVSYVIKHLPEGVEKLTSVVLYKDTYGKYRIKIRYRLQNLERENDVPLVNEYVWIKFDEAFNKNTFLWDDSFISWFMAKSDWEISESTLDFWYSIQIKNGENKGLIPREVRPENYAKYFDEYTKNNSNINPLSLNDLDSLNVNNPFILGRVELEIYNITRDKQRLKKILPKIIDYYNWVEKNRKITVTVDKNQVYLYLWSDLGSGMDNIPRCANCGYSDLISQQAALAKDITQIAEIIGKTNIAKSFNDLYLKLSDQIQKYYYDEGESFVYDIFPDGKKDTKLQTSASFWSLYAHALTQAQADKMINKYILDAKKFGGAPYFPALSRDSELFNAQGGYWRGGIWPPIIWVGINSLDEYGYTNESKSISGYYYNKFKETINEYGTLFEYYSPTTDPKLDYLLLDGNSPRKDFFGWSSIPLVLFPTQQ